MPGDLLAAFAGFAQSRPTEVRDPSDRGRHLSASEVLSRLDSATSFRIVRRISLSYASPGVVTTTYLGGMVSLP
ncbi:MAG: hypothetical protein MH204_08240 [Fimbriimonadaceae bacterium]|nr:hypothetical protein [Fimbriimonadaceae bacterium]